MLFKKIKIIKWNSYDWKFFIIGTLLGILTSICGALLPFFVSETEKIFSNINYEQNEKINKMLLIVLYIFLIGLAGIIAALFSKIYLSKLSAKKLAQLRQQMFDNIQNASLKDIEKYDHGSLIARLTNDIFNFSLYYNWMLINVFPSVIRWVIFTVMTFYLNYIIGFILFSCCIILYLVSYLIARKSINYFEPSLEKLDRLNTIMQENIVGSRIIRAFNLRNRQIERFSKINSKFETLSIKAETKIFISLPFASSFINASTIIIILICGMIGWSGVNFAGTKIDVGTIYAMFSYSYLILWSIYDLIFLYIYDTRSTVSRKRINEILKLRNSIIIENQNEFSYGDIEFKNVSFKFDENVKEYVLKNINFKIPKGSKVGIIGQTGSGKTTLLNLIPRLYKITSGQILIDNQDIETINSDSLQDNISFSFQQKYLFAGSIKENIQLSNENISIDEIYKSLKIAQIEDFVNSKKEGIDFYLEEYGQNLSGGQKQRINIARTIARKANIYIYDDTMSALDNLTEKRVLQGIKKNINDATLIVSSQKISTIKDMDFIIVLDKGTISGIGTHNQLIKSNNIYREINKLQNKGDNNE